MFEIFVSPGGIVLFRGLEYEQWLGNTWDPKACPSRWKHSHINFSSLWNPTQNIWGERATCHHNTLYTTDCLEQRENPKNSLSDCSAAFAAWVSGTSRGLTISLFLLLPWHYLSAYPMPWQASEKLNGSAESRDKRGKNMGTFRHFLVTSLMCLCWLRKCGY